MTETKELAKSDGGGKPQYLLDLEAEAAAKGRAAQQQDNFDQSDVALPRIKLLQATSKEIEAFDTAKAGHFWHTGLDISLGETLDFVVASRNKKYLLVAPLEDGQGILARADHFTTWDRLGKWSVKKKGHKDPLIWEITDKNVVKSGLDQWGTSIADDENSPPAATLFYDYLIFLPDRMDLGPAIFTATRSSISRAKKGLNDKIKLHGDNGRPMQSIVFRATVTKETGDEGDYKNVRFSQNGFAEEAVFKAAWEHRAALAGDYKAQDEESAVHEEAEDAGVKGAAGAKGAGEKEKDF